METLKNNSSLKKKACVVTYMNNVGSADIRAEIFSILDRMDVLSDNKLCLHLIADLAEKVGYQCAGQTGAATVAELMMLSVRALELAKQVE